MTEIKSAKSVIGDIFGTFALKQGPKRKSSFGKFDVSMRRYVRILLVALFCFAIFISFNYLLMAYVKRGTKFLSPEVDIEIYQENCKLFIREVPPVPNWSQLTFRYEVPSKIIGNILIWLDGWVNVTVNETYQKINLTCEAEFMEGCFATLEVPEGVHLSNLEYTCEGKCSLIQETIGLLNFSGSNFSAIGNELDLNILRIHAGQLHIFSESGDIYLQGAISDDDSRIETNYGDIVFQSIRPFLLNWSHDSNLLCFTSLSEFTEISTEGCYLLSSSPIGSEDFLTTDQCEGFAKFGNSENEKIPTIEVFGGGGNIYSNLLNDWDSITTNEHILSGLPYSEDSYFFDKILNKTMTKYQRHLNDTSKSDSIMVIDLGNKNARASSALKLAAATNPAYLYAKPWWISFFSMTLLLGKVYKVEGRLVPGFCPYNKAPTKDELGKVARSLKRKLGVNNNGLLFDVAVIAGKDISQTQTYHEKNSGYKRRDSDISLFTVELDQAGKTQIFENNLMEKTSLFLAIIISLILSGLLGIIGAIASVYSFNHFFIYFAREAQHINKYVSRVENEKENSQAKTKNSAIPKLKFLQTIRQLPQQFAIIDHLVFMVRRTITNTISEFYDQIFVPVQEEMILEASIRPIPFKIIKELYQKYCFLRNFPEMNIIGPENQKFLILKGYEIVKLTDENTEVFTKVRIRPVEDQIEEKIDFTTPKTSLQLFIDTNIEFTEFEEDSIPVYTFMNKYERFCKANRLKFLSSASEIMSEEFGLERVKLESNFLVKKKPDESNKLKKKKVHYLLSIKKMESIISSIIESKKTGILDNDKDLIPNKWLSWLIYDCLSVLLHLVLIAIFMVPPIFVGYLIEMEIGEYSLGEYMDVLKKDDVLIAPWNLILKFSTLSFFAKIGVMTAIGYGIFSIIDLFFYYINLTFPLDTLQIFNPRANKTFFNKVFLYLEWCYLLLMIGLLIGYICLVLVWSILGAILNPQAYLVYASGAGTFITYIQVKIRQLKSLQEGGLEMIKQQLMGRLKSTTESIMKKIIVSTGISHEAFAAGMHYIDQIDTKLDQISSSHELPKGTTPEFEGSQLIKAIKGDENELKNISNVKGIDPVIIEIISAIVNSNPQKMNSGVKKLISKSNFQIEEEIVTTIITLCLKKNLSLSNILILLSETFLKVSEKHFKSKVIQSTRYKLSKSVLGRILEGIIETWDDDKNSFVDIIREINSSLHNNVTSKIFYASKFGNDELKSELLNEDEDDALSLPLFMLDSLELLQIPYNYINNKVNEMGRIKPALYNITLSYLGIDRPILDFFSMFFAASRERLYPTIRTSGSLLKSQQKSILKNCALSLKCDESLLKLFFRIVLEDKSFDIKLIHQLNQLGVEKKLGFHQDIIKKAFHLNAVLFKTENIYDQLLTSSLHFGVNPKNASAILNISNRYLFSPESLIQTAAKSSFMKTMASEFKNIPVSEFFGLICLFMGRLDHPVVDSLLRSVMESHNLSKKFLRALKALLYLFVSYDTKCILESAKMLRLTNPIWILMGKKILHPEMVTEDNYMLWGTLHDLNMLKDNNKIHHLYTRETFSQWLDKMNNYLVFHHLKKVQSKAKKGRDKKTTLKQKLLNLSAERINNDLIRRLLTYWKEQYPESEQIENFEDFLERFLLVKDVIIYKKDAQDAIIPKIAKVLRIETKSLELLIQIISCNPSRIIKSFNQILQGKISQHYQLLEFSKFVSEEMQCAQSIYEGVSLLSESLKIPKVIVSDSLAPFLHLNLTINDAFRILEYGGFSELKSLWTSKTITFTNSLTLLLNLILGYLDKSIESIQGIPEQYSSQFFLFLKLLKAKSDENYQQIINIFKKELSQTFAEALGIDRQIIDTMIVLLSYANGFKKKFMLQTQAGLEQLSMYNYLSRQTGIMPEVFMAIEAVYQNNNSELGKHFKNLFSKAQDMNRLPLSAIQPSWVEGIISIVKGKGISLGQISDALKVPTYLVDVCLMLSNFSKPSKADINIKKGIESLKESITFSQFAGKVKSDPKTILCLLNICFNTVNGEELLEMIEYFELNNQVDAKVLLAFLALSKGYCLQYYLKTERISRLSTRRQSAIQNMKKNLSPLLERIGIDPILGLFTIRLRQGDFYTIRDESKFMKAFLPSSESRHLISMVFGLLTSPIQFRRSLTIDPKTFHYFINYSGCLQGLASVLKLHPHIGRLVGLDPNLYGLIEKKLGFKKEAVAGIITTISEFPLKMMQAIIIREIIKNIYAMRHFLQKNLSLLQSSLRRSFTQTHVPTIISDQDDFSENEQDLEEEGPSQLKEGTLLSAFLQEQLKFSNYYDEKKDNDCPMTTKDLLIEDINLEIKKEQFENCLFNNLEIFDFSFDSFANSNIYQILKAEAKELINVDKDEFQEKAFGQFRINTEEDPHLNIWRQLSYLLETISKGLLDEKPQDYSRITLTQIVFFCLILRIRNRIKSNHYADSSQEYGLLIGELLTLLYSIEGMFFFVNSLGRSFDRIRILKVLGLGLNIKVSNILENFYDFPCLFSLRDFSIDILRTSLNSSSQINRSIDQLNKIEGKLQEIMDTFDELELLNMFSEDPILLSNHYAGADPYHKSSIKKWDILHFPQFSNSSINTHFPNIVTEKSRIKRQMMILPKSLEVITQDSTQDSKLDVDKISGLPIPVVRNLMEDVERFMCVEDDQYIFIDSLSGAGNLDILSRVFPTFHQLHIFKSEESLTTYQYLYESLCIRTAFNITNGIETNINGLKALCYSLSEKISPVIAEDFIQLALGNFDEKNFFNFGSCFGVGTDVISILFYSSYTKLMKAKYISLGKIIPKFAKCLSVDEELLEAMIESSEKKRAGWVQLALMTLGTHLKSSKYGIASIEKFLELIDFESTSPSSSTYNIIPINMENASECLTEFYRIKARNNEKTSQRMVSQMKNNHPQLLTIFGFFNSFFQKDHSLMFVHLPDISNMLKLDIPMDHFSLIKAFYVMFILRVTQDEIQDSLIEESMEPISSWILSLITVEDEIKRRQIYENINGMVEAIFGTLLKNIKRVKNGANRMTGDFSFKLDILAILKNVKFMTESDVNNLINLNGQEGQDISSLLLYLINEFLSKDNSYQIAKEEGESSYENIKGIISDTATQCFNDQLFLSSKAENLEESKVAPSTMIELFKERINEAELQNINHPIMPNFVMGIILGNFHLLSHILLNNQIADENYLNILDILVKLRKMSEDSFKYAVETKDSEYMKMVKSVTNFIGNNSLKNHKKRIEKITELGEGYEFEIKEKESYLKLLTSNEAFPMIFVLFHACEYKALLKTYMFDSIIDSVFGASGNISETYKNQFIKMVLGLYNISNISDIHNLTIKKEESQELSIEPQSRMRKLLQAVIEIYCPDLKRLGSIFQRILMAGYNLYRIPHSQKKEKLVSMEKTSLKFPFELSLIFGGNVVHFEELIKLVTGDLTAIAKISPIYSSQDLSKAEQLLTMMIKTKKMLEEMHEKSFQDLAIQNLEKEHQKQIQVQMLNKKVKSGNAEIQDLFTLIDKDNSGGISKKEFKTLMNRLHIRLSQHRIDEIYTKIKKESSVHEQELNIKEFQEALTYVQSKKTQSALHMLGFSTSQLIMFFLLLTLILLLLFAFIFLGIHAFSMGSTFGSIINSFLPMAAGGAVGSKDPGKSNEGDEMKKQTEQAVEEVTTILNDE